MAALPGNHPNEYTALFVISLFANLIGVFLTGHYLGVKLHCKLCDNDLRITFLNALDRWLLALHFSLSDRDNDPTFT
jgi:hypothetical protein